LPGELLASSEKEVTFYEYSSRPEVLKNVGSKKVHNLDDFESLWLSYFDQIAAGSEIVKFDAPVTLTKW
jgi:hypothetical protein